MKELRRVRTAAGGAALLLALTACNLFGGGDAPTPVPSDIKPADALKLAADTWTGREGAFVSLDPNKIDAAETGDLATADRSTITARTRFNRPGEKTARVLADLKVYDPHQKDYPAHFLAIGTAPDLKGDMTPTDKTYTHLMVLIKADPDTPYKAALITAVDPAQSIPEIKVAKDGYAELVAGAGQAATLKAASSQMGQKMADELNGLTTGGRPDPALAAGAFTTQEADLEKKLVGDELGRGIDLKISRSGQENAANYTYATVDGQALELFAMHTSVLFVASSGNGGGNCIVFLPTGADILKRQDAGIYRALNLEMSTMMAAVVPPASDKTRLISVPAAFSVPVTLENPPCS